MFFLPGWFQLLQNIVYTRCSTQQPAEPEVIGLLETILINIQTNPIIDNQPTSQPKPNNQPTSQPKTDNQPTRTPTFKSVNY